MLRAKADELPIVRDLVLKGHGAGIQCVAISPDGNTILSADDDACIFVWNIKTGEAIQQLSSPYNGAVGAILWLTLKDETNAFAFGCADGSIQLYKERQSCRGSFEFVSMMDFSGPVECLAFDPNHRRLASVGGGCLQVWNITDAGSLIPINEDVVRKTVVAKTVIFADDGASVVVFYLESHEISCYTIEPWALKWTKLVPTRNGHACICMADGAFVHISNLKDGIDQYRFPSFERVQSFTHPILTNLPLQVATTARGQWIVCGGDSGFARVFSRRTGEVLQILDHLDSAKSQPVQVIATHETDERSIIVTGSSGEGASDLQIWYERVFEPPPLPGTLPESAKADEVDFSSTVKTIIIYTFVAVFALQLLLVGIIYLSWPLIKPLVEGSFQSAIASEPLMVNPTPISYPTSSRVPITDHSSTAISTLANRASHAESSVESMSAAMEQGQTEIPSRVPSGDFLVFVDTTRNVLQADYECVDGVCEKFANDDKQTRN